jgi:[ribosomal protein S5]-alanine N-acetyltransferase
LSAPHLSRVLLRAPRPDDAADFVRLRRESRAELEPFAASADRGPEDFARILAGADSPRRRRRMIVRRSDARLLGAIALTRIARGILQNANVDYWLGTPYVGQGYMGEALALCAAEAFGPLGLHRLEALVLPENQRSRRLLERAGFHCEGLARSLVRVRGEWRDHERWVLLNGN